MEHKERHHETVRVEQEKISFVSESQHGGGGGGGRGGPEREDEETDSRESDTLNVQKKRWKLQETETVSLYYTQPLTGVCCDILSETSCLSRAQVLC